MKKILSITVLSLALIWVGCKKSVEIKAPYTNLTADKALLKINFNSMYFSNPSVQLSVNGTRVSGLLTARTPFPGGGYNVNGSNFPDYLATNPGTAQIGVAIPKRNTAVDSVPLFTGTASLMAGKYYTVHIADTGTKAKMVVTEDDLTVPPPRFSKFQFVNLMPNVPAIDLYYGPTLVARNVPYLGQSAVFLIETPATSLAWTIRETGTAATSTALATYSSANTTINQRIYTAFAIGYKGVTGTTDPRRPFISFLLNR